jgi:hypothetical protein
MVVRLLAAGLLAAILAAPAATAGGSRIVVRPGEPVVNTRSTIEVRAPVSVKRLVVRLVTPTGVPLRVALYREGPGVWRKRYRFMDDGTWTLLVRLRGTLVSRKVFVKQPPEPVPPFKPAQKTSLFGVAGGGVFIVPLP